MSATPKLELPYLAAGQAQKHVTINDALRKLDALVQLSVISRTLTTAPASPSEGDRYLVGVSPSGVWAGQSGKLAAYQDGGWSFFSPRNGWLAWVVDETTLLVFNGTNWVINGNAQQNLILVGINATADTTNRMSVSASASLFNQEGGSHRLKVNKSAASDTASMIFQTGYSARAEIGTSGSDDFCVRTSTNGTNWLTAIRVDALGQLHLGPNAAGLSMSSGQATIECCSDIPGDRVAFFDFHASDNQPDHSARIIRYQGMNGDFEFGNSGTGSLRLMAYNGGDVRFGSGMIDRISMQSSGNMVPVLDNAYALGGSGARFSAIWAANGVIQTSDARDKIVEARLGDVTASKIVDKVEPILFRWKVGGKEAIAKEYGEVSLNPDNPDAKTAMTCEQEIVEHEGRRLHAGFLAQEIHRALEEEVLDFGVWGCDAVGDPESRQWIRPDQLIPVLWAALRETRRDLNELKNRR